MSAYEDLMAFQRDTSAIGQIAGRLGWDQETMMPRGAASQRGDEMAAIEGVLHARRTDPRVEDWLASISDDDLAPEAQAQMRLVRRSYERSRRVPARLASEIARVTSEAQGIWAEARATEDTATFLPVLKRVLALRREEGAALADGEDVYDALLDDYEPGATAASLEKMFGALRPRLLDLRQRILEKPQPKPVHGVFDEAAQLALTRQIASVFGYDMARGRLDKAVHPFSSGSGNDVRITTRTSPSDPFNCLYSTIHEVGHACYEQAISQDYLLTPLGSGVSMGVHESQSRIYENQLGRSRAFTGWLYGRMIDSFGDIGVGDEDGFHAAVNRVHNGFIRTEADEVQYNLHVLMRFDLERSMICGALDVEDLESAWNARFLSDFGYAVDRPSNGMLQDVHWSVGLFGYFPTYTLGNVYAGCLHKALREAVPDLDAQLSQGDLGQATGWLRQNVQRHGGLYRPRDVIARACGHEPNEAPLLEYLESKFGEIYGL